MGNTYERTDLGKAKLWNQSLYILCNIPTMLKIFSHLNMPYPTIPDDVPLTPETISPPTTPYPTTLVVMPVRAAPQN